MQNSVNLIYSKFAHYMWRVFTWKNCFSGKYKPYFQEKYFLRHVTNVLGGFLRLLFSWNIHILATIV